MKKSAAAVLAALGVLAALVVGATQSDLFTGATAPDPLTCTGYPEPRIFLENQSWWEPQEADYRDSDHAGAGKQGHIHVSTCFPLHQNVSGSSLHFDVRIQYHNLTGYTPYLRADMYGDRSYDVPRPLWTSIYHCDTVDCDNWVSFDVPLENLQYGGVHELNIYPIVQEAQQGVGPWEKQYPISRWYLNVVNGKPDPPAGSVAAIVRQNADKVGGDSWYATSSGGKYARVWLDSSEIPWNHETGELVAISGIWTPTVHFEKRHNFVYIDPALHATPPNFGTIVYDHLNPTGEAKKVSIDTTKLTDGIHRLLIGTGNPSSSGTHSGTAVFRFLVNNVCVT